MSQGSLQVMLLHDFVQQGGIDAVVRTASNFSAAFDELNPSSSSSAKLEQVHVFSGLKVALGLLQSLVSAKVVFESPQTTSLASRDKPVTSEDYFDPYQFLIRLRLAILPFVKSIWQSSWLLTAPVAVSRSVIHTILSIMDSAPEVKPATTGFVPASQLPGAHVAPGAPVPRPPPPPERIQQLVDMGFSTHAATEALRRCHNNTGIAAEYLLTHPGAFAAPPPAPVPAPAAPVPAAEAAAGAAASDPAATGDVDMTDESPESVAERKKEKEEQEAKQKEAEKAQEELWRDRRPELDEARKDLRDNLTKRALELADRYESLVYDIKPAFVNSTEAIDSITAETQSFSDAIAFGSTLSQVKVDVRLRLLALILHDGPASLVADVDRAQKVMDLIVGFAQRSSAQEGRPVWLPSQLHVAEALLILTENITHVDYLPADAALDKPSTISLFQGPAFVEARSALFKLCLSLLPKTDLSREQFASALRLLVILTRDYQLALKFARQGGVHQMLAHYKTSQQAHSGCQAFIAIILRHVVESPDTLKEIMSRTIKQWLGQPRTKVVDVQLFIKNNRSIALRNPQLFKEVVEAECVIIETFNAGIYHITLKTPPAAESTKDAQAKDADGVKSDATPSTAKTAPPPSEDLSSSMQVDNDVTTSPDFEVIESVVHHLLSELQSVGKQAVKLALRSQDPTPEKPTTVAPASTSVGQADVTSAAPAAASASADVVPTPGSVAPGAMTTSDENSNYVYTCLLMQNLTELLGSYMSCKTA